MLTKVKEQCNPVLDTFWDTELKATLLNMDRLQNNFRRLRKSKGYNNAFALQALNKSLRELNQKLEKA